MADDISARFAFCSAANHFAEAVAAGFGDFIVEVKVDVEAAGAEQFRHKPFGFAPGVRYVMFGKVIA
jgi:hypothetical protein